MLVPSRATPLEETGTTRGAVGADFRSSQDVEEYLVQVARVNRADPVATGQRGGVPLSSGEIERLRREDFEKRRKLRLIQVREQAKTIAIARRQNFIEDIDRKRAQEKERRRKAWEAQQREKIQRCTQEYKLSLAAIGNAHLEAQQHATRTQAEKARKKALHARARIKEDARHKAALLTQRQEKAAQTFFVHKAQEEHRRLVREYISDEHRAKARRNAHATEKARQRALASQAAAEAAQAAALRRRDRVIDISATVPNVATRLQDFAATRFHASLTQHAPAHNLPVDNRSRDARDALETSSDADFDNARTTPRDAFEAATVLNRNIQDRVASESHQRAEHEALAAQRGRQALQEVRAVREQQDLQDALDALRKEEISSNSRDVVQKIRNSWQKRTALDDHKRKLQQRIFEQNFVQAAPSPSPSATFAKQTSTSARPQPEILHVIPETELLNQNLLASSTSAADDSRVESPNEVSQVPEKTTPPSPIGADEGERLAHHDLRPSKSNNAAGDAAPAAFDQRAHDLFDTSAAADQSVSSIAIPTAPPQHSMTHSSGIQDDENSDSDEEIDEETRALLEASRKARKRGNQSVQAILKMGQSFLEGSATDYTSSTNGNRRSGRADTTTTTDDDNDVDKSTIKGRPFRVPRNVTSSSSSPTGESSSVSSTDLSLHARAAAAASAAARAAADAAAQHARNQTSSFPTREQLEQSLTRFLLGDDSDIDQDEDDDIDADQNDRVSSVADYLTREHVGLNASFVSSTSSDRSWEPRRAPGERPGALNDLAISVLRDLEARPARSALQASFSVASSEVSSLRQFPLSPSSRPSTAAGLGQSRGPLQDGDIEDLIVHDDSWKDSAALTDWIHQVETALHNQEEEEHDNIEPSSASNKGISSSAKDLHSVQAAADASAPAQASQEANVEDLIVEDDGWKDDERFASFTADLAQYFETSNTPVSQSRGTPRQVFLTQSGDQDDREVLATPEESVASETPSLVQTASKPTPPNTEARVNRALQTPTMDAKFDDLDARIQSAARAARAARAPPASSPDVAARQTPTQKAQDMTTPPNTEARVHRALQTPTMDAKFDDLDARIQSAARAARAPPASSPDRAAHQTPTQKAQDMTTPPNTEARVHRALQTPTIDAKFDDLDARIQSAARAARAPPASSSDVAAHQTPTPKAQDMTTPPDTEARVHRALQSPTMDAKFDDLEARLRSAERAAHAGLESPNEDRDASLLIFEGNETSSHTELDASPARHLKVAVDSPPSTATAAQSSKSSLDSLEQVQRALKTAREELRAAAALRESPNEITFGSLLDPSADINLGLSDSTAPHLEASPPLPATSSEDEKNKDAGNIKDDSALAFHEELFGISVTEELDNESLESPVPLSSHLPPSLERERNAETTQDQNDDHDAKDRAMSPKRDVEEDNEELDSLSSPPPSPKPTKRHSPQAFAVNFSSDNADELLVRMPQSPTRADLERQRRQQKPPTPDLLQEEHESASGAVAFAVDIRPPAESDDARSRAFQERSARRAAEAQERARRKEAANAQRRKSQSPPSQPPPPRAESNSSESARGPARASFGQRVAVDPREQRARTARLFRKLPEVRQREQEEAQRRQAEERRQRVRKMEEERRKVLFRKR